MARALLVTQEPAFGRQLADLLQTFRGLQFTRVSSGLEARRICSLQEFDLIFIDELVRTESGLVLAEYLTAKTEAIILLFCAERRQKALAEDLQAKGILVQETPPDPTMFRQNVGVMLASVNRLENLRSQNLKLNQKLQDLKRIHRAKLLLMTVLKMSEEQAHQYIQKQAMERRVSTSRIAEAIIQTYR